MKDRRAEIHVDSVAKTGNNNKLPVWFVFSGMGSQWSGMGRDLMQFHIFEESIKKSSLHLSQHGIDLCDLIMNAKEEAFDHVLNSFVAIVSVQVNKQLIPAD